jgi:hypothetical protein
LIEAIFRNFFALRQRERWAKNPGQAGVVMLGG